MGSNGASVSFAPNTTDGGGGIGSGVAMTHSSSGVGLNAQNDDGIYFFLKNIYKRTNSIIYKRTCAKIIIKILNN